MHPLLAIAIALAAVHQAQAQNAKTIEIVTSTAMATEFAETATVTSSAKILDETEPSLSELTSRIGPFYETLMFMPGMNRGHFLSAIASNGNNDETTTFVGFEPSFVTHPDWMSVKDTEDKTTLAYGTFTWAPSTYIESWTETPRGTAARSMVMTTHCSHAYTEAATPLPSSVRETLVVESLGTISVAAQLPSVSAVCMMEKKSGVVFVDGTAKVGATTVTTTLGLRDLNYGWKVLTVLGETPAAAVATATSSGATEKPTRDAAQTRSGSETPGDQSTSTQTAGTSAVTAWVNSVVVVVAAAAAMIV